MRVKKNEYLKLTVLSDNGQRVLDIRIWKRTPTGGVFTNKTLIVSKRMIVPLIVGLQKIHQAESAIESQITEVA